MTTPLTPDKALYLPIEIMSKVDFGPMTFTLGTQAESNNKLEYDDEGKPVQTPYDLDGYTVTATITTATSAYDFTVNSADLSGGTFSISLDDTTTTALAGLKTTTKPTEKIGEYRIYLTQGSITKVKIYGPVSINTAGA